MDPEEQQAIEELKAMSRAELDRVPYTPLRWICGCKGCERYTRVRDYGILPEFYHPRWGWLSLRHYLLCAKHGKLFKRLEKGHPKWRIENRLLDKTKECLLDPATGERHGLLKFL